MRTLPRICYRCERLWTCTECGGRGLDATCEFCSIVRSISEKVELINPLTGKVTMGVARCELCRMVLDEYNSRMTKAMMLDTFHDDYFRHISEGCV